MRTASLPPVSSSPFSCHHPACECNPSLLRGIHKTSTNVHCSAVFSGFPAPFTKPCGRVAQRCLSHHEPDETKHRYCSYCMDGKPNRRATKCRTTALRYLSLSFKSTSHCLVFLHLGEEGPGHQAQNCSEIPKPEF